MATEVIHVKSTEDGYRITLDEPHGLVNASRKVRVHVPGMKYDHDGARDTGEVLPNGQPEFRNYKKGEEVGFIDHYLAGQIQFTVPKEASELEFDDGTTYSLTSDAEGPDPVRDVPQENVPVAPEAAQQ